MDGALSQDEINALLSGIDLSEDDESGTVGSSKGGNENAEGAVQSMEEANELLSDVEKDAVGEVANISMGSSATTLYSLVSRKVNITTPVVEFATWDDLLNQYERPCVFIQIKYTVGLDGTNILILKEQDVKVITDLMMGGDGTNTDGELGELHLSAISEAMNQMMGASATSLSTMMKTKIDISPPEAELLDLAQVRNGEDISPFLKGIFVKISFRMQIDDLVDSSIMQLYPIDFARKVVDTFMDSQSAAQEKPPVQETAPTNTAGSQRAGGCESSGRHGSDRYERAGWHEHGNADRNGSESPDGHECCEYGDEPADDGDEPADDGDESADDGDGNGDESADDEYGNEPADDGYGSAGGNRSAGSHAEYKRSARAVSEFCQCGWRCARAGKYRPYHGCPIERYRRAWPYDQVDFRDS